MLSDQDILKAMKSGAIVIEPFNKQHLGPDSVDLTLDNTLLIAQQIGEIVDPRHNNQFFKEVVMDDEGFLLLPGMFILGSTRERISLSDNVAAQLEGRSTIGRLGIMVHVTAGVIHAGFGKQKPSALTLEIYSVNSNPVRIYPGMKIAQLSFFYLHTQTNKPYDETPHSKYKAQLKPRPPISDQ